MTIFSDSADAWRPTVDFAATPERPPAPARPAAAGKDEEFSLFGQDGFTFLDFLDIINPLQHIPVVGAIYRRLSGDGIDPGARVLGGTLFFGPFGSIASIGDVLIREATGRDIGQHAIALFEDGAPDSSTAAKAAATRVADAGPMPAKTAAAETEAVDPITAWAMGEMAYRKSVAAKTHAFRAAPAADSTPPREQAALSLPAPVAGDAVATTAIMETAPWRDRNAAGREATAIIRHTKKSAALFAASNHGRVTPAGGERTSAADRPAPFGAVAAEGGWFTEVMLSAHEKYRNGGGHALGAQARTVDLIY